MRPLRPADPTRVGPYRMLARLGAGGMGVVYLGRSPSGAVAAVKLIQTVHAADKGFRARFAREVDAARDVDSRWIAPLLDADPDAEAPWLATAFVPGPSLDEAIALHGPLPPRTLRILGSRLAEALEAVHRAGLVHRDVKPGNVLLGLDGPRLIDFGIARSPDGTALTSSGVVVGSPGFLSPEQARAQRAEIAPPSDVFSLGCVLAYAATGVRPFGNGPAAAALLRTVSEDPDLDDVPAELAPLLRTCLTKRPQDRPRPATVRASLTGAKDSTGPWLPEPVTRLIADRSAQVLRIAAVEATEVPAPPPAPHARMADAETVTALPPGGVPPTGTTRRRFLALGSAAGAVAAGAGGAWWAWTRPDTTTAASGGTPQRPVLALAFHGDLSGAAKATAQAQENGARIAVDHVNAQHARPFRLALTAHDDRGVPSRAVTVAERLAADPSVRAVVGPTTDACALATVLTYHAASLPIVAVSPGVDPNSRITEDMAPRAYIAARPHDPLLAAPCTTYLVRTAGSRRAVLLDDREQGVLSWDICQRIASGLRNAGRRATILTVERDMDAQALAAEVKAARADGVVFTGDEARAAALARTLTSTGYTGARMGIRQGFGTRFLREAGSAAEGWVFTTPFVEATGVPAARGFTTAYRKRFRTAPPWYAAEAYDAVMFLAQAMTHGRAFTDRGSIVRHAQEIRYRGISRTLAYSATDGGVYDKDGLFLYRVSGGAFTFLGQYAQSPNRQ